MLPPVTLAVAEIRPAVRKLPPVILPTALSANPPMFDTITVVLAGNVTLPVPSAVPIVMMVLELATPAVPILMFFVAPSTVAPVPRLYVALAVIVPMSALALATVNDPVADIKPPVKMLPPVMLPVADTTPLASIPVLSNAALNEAFVTIPILPSLIQ